MAKMLLISGSPRQGNTEHILNRVCNALGHNARLILLRELHIEHCTGCETCSRTHKCIIQDDMQKLYDELLSAELIIIGTPNYFESVPGLLKDFIDRTNALYETRALQGKRLVVIVVGAYPVQYSLRVVRNVFRCFSTAHRLRLLDKFCFQGDKPGEAAKSPSSAQLIQTIVDTAKGALAK